MTRKFSVSQTPVKVFILRNFVFLFRWYVFLSWNEVRSHNHTWGPGVIACLVFFKSSCLVILIMFLSYSDGCSDFFMESTRNPRISIFAGIVGLSVPLDLPVATNQFFSVLPTLYSLVRCVPLPGCQRPEICGRSLSVKCPVFILDCLQVCLQLLVCQGRISYLILGLS